MPVTQLWLFLFHVARIRFGKGGGDLGPPADLPRSHGHESYAFARRTGIRPKPCPALKRDCLAFPNPACAGNRIRATVAMLTPFTTVIDYSSFLFVYCLASGVWWTGQRASHTIQLPKT